MALGHVQLVDRRVCFVGEGGEPDRPILIVGSPRSGTSVLLSAIRDGAGVPGFGEGHLLPLVHAMVQAVEMHYKRKAGVIGHEAHLITHVDASFWREALFETVRSVYGTLHDERRWVDKTGDGNMIRACPLLCEVWPEVRFVFARRRGIENVLSRLRKFPRLDLRTHAQHWAECMNAWRGVRNDLAGRCVEIDQRDIGTRPVEVAERLRGFLGFDVLAREKMITILSGQRPQQTSNRPDETYIPLEKAGWTEQEQQSFLDVAGEAMRDFHYPITLADFERAGLPYEAANA